MEPARPSLSESWASISDAEYSHDEDLHSEITDAGSLIDVHSANDVQSVREDTPSEDESSDEEYEVQEPLVKPQIQLEVRSSIQSKTPGASCIVDTNLQTDEITLDEPDFLPQEQDVLVKHTLTAFGESEAARLQLPCSSRNDYIGTLHMTLSRAALKQNTRQSFRLLLLGRDYTESLRASLVNKVADALVASTDGNESHTPPSRYHVIPDSFGPGCQPAAAELIPVDHTLDVESFHSALLGGDNNKDIVLCNKDTVQRTVSTFNERAGKYIVTNTGWQQPDLAIVLIDSKDSADARLSACTMMIFAKRLKIPMIVVRMDNDWNADFAPLIFADAGAQLCIEKRPLSQRSVLRNLPLDLNTFLNINPAQIGRHVAYLVQNADTPPKSSHKTFSGPKSLVPDHILFKVKDTVDNMVGFVQDMRPRRILQMIAVLAGTLIFLQWLTVVKNGWNARYPGPVPSIVERLSTNPIVPVSSTSDGVDLSATTNSFPVAIRSHTANAQRFEAETLGNSHIIARIPGKASKSQNFNINVYKKDTKLETKTKILFPGVFSIHLDPGLAYGALDVCYTTPKPLTKDCVEVNLGEQSFAAWVKELIDDGEDRLQQHFAGLHDTLEDMRKSERPRDSLKEAQKRLRDLEQAAQQDLKTRWATLSARHAGAVDKIIGFIGKVQSNVGETLKIKCADAKAAFRGSRESAADLLDRINVEGELRRLRQEGRKQIQSERLATSQERAQHIVEKVREKLRRLP